MSKFDVVITGARIVDGTGNPWFYGDIALSGDRIAAISPAGRLATIEAREVVAAPGMVVCPGFIDIQSHSLYPLFADGRSLSKITQGVTTEILGELWTPAPQGGRRKPLDMTALPPEAAHWTRFGDWLDYYAQKGTSVNVGSFVGGANVREYAKGWEMGDPSDEELAIMRRVTAEAMEDGAFGIAPALIYPPSSYSPDYELLEVARVVGEYRGIYIVHLRSEGDTFLEALATTIELGRQAQVAVEIYHLKATGERNWHKMREAIAMIDAARAEGVDIAADMYPYVASGTGLTVLLPNWASEGGNLFDTLRDPEARARIRAEMLGQNIEALATAYGRNRDYVVPLGFKKPENRQYIGKNLTEIAEMRNQNWADAALDLLISEEQRIGTVYFTMSEENLKLQLQQPWIKISTDAGGVDPATQENPIHPRAYGTYPRVLSKYVREEKVLTIEDAVRKMSSAVADRLGLRDRGLLRAGNYADVVVFDPLTVTDCATFTDSHRLSTGIQHVWVNGVRVLQDGQHTGALPGKLVFGPGKI